MDYGCGKGGLVRALQEKYPDIKVRGYDPAVKEFEKLPNRKFDLVVNTDVLEHIPEDELPETVERIAGFSQNVFFHLHHAPASQILENGENAHCTVWTPQQYNDLFKKFFPTTIFLPGMSLVNTSCITFQLPEDIAAQCVNLIQGFTPTYFQDLQQLIQTMHTYKEVVVYPFDNLGNQFLEYLKYSNLLEKVSCLATETVGNLNTQQIFYENKIYLPFEMLVHFKESAIFIVAAPMQYHQVIGQSLHQFGVKNFVFIGDNTHKQIQEELRNFYSQGVVMAHFMNDVNEKLKQIYEHVEYQNEIAKVQTQAFAEYKNAFRGRKVVIYATGPTAKYYKPMKDAIHIGLNFAWRQDEVPLDYLFTGDNNTGLDGTRPMNTIVEEGFKTIKHKIFVGISLPPSPYIFLNCGYDITLMDKIRRYYSGNMNDGRYIPRDISLHPLWGMATIAEAAICFALFTYPKELYLVGCDVNPTYGHFYKEREYADPRIRQLIQNALATHRLKVAYARFKMFARQYYPDTEIISINPVGLKGLFKDVYTEEYLNRGEVD